MDLLITGGCGFLGSNLARYGIQRGHTVTVFDNMRRDGAFANLMWLKSLGDLSFIHGDISNAEEVTAAVRGTKPDAVFHVAGQVAMTTSITNPRRDFEINALGALNILEAIRGWRNTPVIYASTNKVYGDLSLYTYEETGTRYVCNDKPQGFDEATPLQFESPYGCSKGAADQYFMDYHRTFGLATVVFRHSSIYGERQFATYDQGWIGWFCQQGLKAKHSSAPFTISGNGKQVRDILHVNDAVLIYYAALDHIQDASGCAFNVGGGPSNSISLLELFREIEACTGIQMLYDQLPWRHRDQKVFIADIARAKAAFHWQPEITVREGIGRMLQWACDMSAA